MNNAEQLDRLRQNVEAMVGRKMSTPRDFSFLANHIFSRLHIMMSPTTLKRLWGYLKEDSEPRQYTLDVLSQYIGYNDWAAFCSSQSGGSAPQSNFIASRTLSVDNLSVGDKVILTWLPDRKCVIEYRGNNDFIILSSENSKIKEGDTFKCSAFIEGEPLYIDNLRHGDMEGISYVAGMSDGIRFELLD